MKRYHVVFTRQVQGVGFRWVLLTTARQFGLTGWARNCPDGTVEVEVQGPEDNLDTFMAQVRQPDEWIQIFDCRIKEIPLIPNEKIFSVTY